MQCWYFSLNDCIIIFQMSAITVGCMQTYKGSVEKTCDEVDANIKVGSVDTLFFHPSSVMGSCQPTYLYMAHQ